ncbi:hypothetical protein [Jatrophihabitans sp.]|jgi:hypothetical protein|uniref:hypothetical protein n=1 Tax=Jatrophihabitans sp. TaxID=1932789 RepID=UPI002F20AE8C
MADSPFDALASPAQTIGRYFSILSVIPSALLVTFVLVLHNSQAWSGHPDFGHGFSSLGDGGFGKVGQIALASLLVGLVLQPLQYTLVQLAEGYWGTSKLATWLMLRRIEHHRQVRKTLNTTVAEAIRMLEAAGESPLNPDHEPVSEGNLVHLVRFDEANRALASYPHRPNDVRPTRLGNILRRYESEGGEPYGLGVPTIAPHVGLIAPRDHTDYVDDQRTQMDLAVRLVVINLLASLLAVVFLWRDGLWLLIAVGPYALAYVFYRGAVTLAADYGTALATVVDLNRFLLYDRLHLPVPNNSVEERTQSAQLMTLLRSDLHPDERTIVDLTFSTAAPAKRRRRRFRVTGPPDRA